MTPVLVNGAQAGSYGVEMVQNKKNCTPDHFTVPLNGAITPKKQFIFNRNWSGICKMRNCEPLWSGCSQPFFGKEISEHVRTTNVNGTCTS